MKSPQTVLLQLTSTFRGGYRIWGYSGGFRLAYHRISRESLPTLFHFPNDPTRALVSMGNYIFNTRQLINELEEDAVNENSSHDFGKDILPK